MSGWSPVIKTKCPKQSYVPNLIAFGWKETIFEYSTNFYVSVYFYKFYYRGLPLQTKYSLSQTLER